MTLQETEWGRGLYWSGWR